MATINTFQAYCNLHNLKVMNRHAIIMEIGSEELEDDVLAWGVGQVEEGYRLPVAILKVGGQVEVMKKWWRMTCGRLSPTTSSCSASRSMPLCEFIGQLG
jgi:hypothetical protein